MLALRNAPEVENAFTFDEMMRAPILTRALPLIGRSCGLGPYPRPVGDTDATQLQEWLQREALPRIAKEMTFQAIERRSRARSFHPVRDYLNGLAWDQTPRLDRWLVAYLGAEPSDYIKAIGRMFLIAIAARIYEPGCQAAYMMVLEGDQGGFKSTGCCILAEPWFSDSLPDIHDKDASQHLRGKWLIEVAKLSAIGRAEFGTLEGVHLGPCRALQAELWPLRSDRARQCLFAGTQTTTPICATKRAVDASGRSKPARSISTR